MVNEIYHDSVNTIMEYYFILWFRKIVRGFNYYLKDASNCFFYIFCGSAVSSIIRKACNFVFHMKYKSNLLATLQQLNSYKIASLIQYGN